MTGLISQQGLQPEVPGYKPPEAFEIPKTPDLAKGSREGIVARPDTDELATEEKLSPELAREKILEHAESLKPAGTAEPVPIDGETQNMLTRMMNGDISMDEVVANEGNAAQIVDSLNK